MDTNTPRILSIGIGAEIYPGRSSVTIAWTATPDRQIEIDLSGWIATGGEILAPLRDPGLFGAAQVTEFGDAIFWGDEDCDLAIDAVHLDLISREQEPMSKLELIEWQGAASLSNVVAAGVLGVTKSTFFAYKAGASIPQAIAIACRASLRDPIILQALLRPAPPAGRPRKAEPAEH